MATIINIGVRREHIESRARVLTEAGHTVKNAFSMTDLEHYLRDGDAELVVIGHNLPGSEKRRVLKCLSEVSKLCRVVEVYALVPELMTADAHVSWDQGPAALLEAVDTAVARGKHDPLPSEKAS